MAERSVQEGWQSSIIAACSSLSLSRATYYRHKDSSKEDADIELRHQIQLVALDMPSYGYRRITVHLHRQGWEVNHKRVLRLMREDNLLCLRKKRYIITTDSEHGLLVYPNLAGDMIVDGLNQLWVADITYVRLEREFIYLAVILDVYSRRCVGWSLGKRLDKELAISALQMALESRSVGTGLVHHSDRGVQYASREYTDLLNGCGISISMSRKGNPYDNAYAESFMKILKYEEVYMSEYRNIQEASQSIGYFIEEVYNLKRLHSSLGYVPPVEYEQMLQTAAYT